MNDRRGSRDLLGSKLRKNLEFDSVQIWLVNGAPDIFVNGLSPLSEYARVAKQVWQLA